MTPQQALLAQIDRNDRAIAQIESGDVDKQLNGKLADEGRVYILRELKAINDGLKRAPTDIDVLLQHGRTTFAIEAKNYAPSTMIPLDRYRADLDSLVAYRRENGNQVVPVFSMSNRPEDVRHLKLLQHEAKKRQVELIFGSAEESVEQIKLLGELR